MVFESDDALTETVVVSFTCIRVIGSVTNLDGVWDLDGAFDEFRDAGLECLECRKSSKGISSDLLVKLIYSMSRDC